MIIIEEIKFGFLFYWEVLTESVRMHNQYILSKKNHSNNEVYASGWLAPSFFHRMSLPVLSRSLFSFFVFVLGFPFKMVNCDKCLTVLNENNILR